MKLRLQSKYTLSITAVIVVVALVLTAGLHMQFNRAAVSMENASETLLAAALNDALNQEALAAVHFAAAVLAEPLARGDRAAIAGLLKEVETLQHSIIAVSAFDHHGRLLHSTATREAHAIPLTLRPGEPAIARGPEWLVATAPVRRGERIVGAVRLDLAHDGHLARVQQMRDHIDALRVGTHVEATMWAALLMLGLIGAGVLVSGWLARRMSQPITALAQAVRDLPEATGTIIPVRVGHDEIAELTRAFAHMRVRLDETTVSRDFLEAIITGMHEGLVVTDAEGRIRLVNQATTALLGETREALNGRLFAELFAFPFHYEDVAQAPVTETMLRRADNQAILVAISRSCINAAGVGGDVFVLHDITEQKRLVRELENYRSRLEFMVAVRTRELTAALQELEAFSYSVSHDLHAPLRAINGFGAALWEDYHDRLDEGARDYLERMRAATVRMGELIDGLLELSRVVRAELVMEPVDLSALASEIGQLLTAADPSRRLDLRIAPGLAAAGDRRLLRSLLHNLMENAWKFTRSQTTVEIGVGVSERKGVQVFFVRDNGEGFDSHESQRVFEPFLRLHPDVPGTGLGLATATRIVQRHGGRLWAESTPGVGTVFHFTLDSSTGDRSYEESRESSSAPLS
ncbi:MAG: ATP-binding protein [Gammaproteobacteria bacterium]|nr:ATP-binding protein [Gammaproteobacteria bacterium]